MQSMWEKTATGITLDLTALPPGSPDCSPSPGRYSLSPVIVADSQLQDEPPYLGPTVVPHHESSVRCVAHRFVHAKKCANAFLGMESGEILSLLDQPPDASGNRPELKTEKFGDHKSPITALFIFRETLISSDKDGVLRMWDLREDAPSPRLRAVLKSSAQINAMTVQGLNDVLSSQGRKFVCPPSSILAACLPDALLFTGEEDSSLSVWSLSTTKLRNEAGVLSDGKLVRRVDSYGATRALVSSGRILVSSSIGRMLCFWDTRRSSFETQLTLPTGSQVCSLVMLGDHVYGGCEDGCLRVWALTRGRLGAQLLTRVDAHPGVAIRHLNKMDAQYLLTASDQGLLQAWRPVDLKLLWKYESETKQVKPSAISPSRRTASFGRHPAKGRIAMVRHKTSSAKIALAAGGHEAGVHRVTLRKVEPSIPLGISLISLGTGSVAVGLLLPGGIAKTSGLLCDLDTIIAVNGKEVTSCEAVRQAVGAAERDVEFVVRRNTPESPEPSPDEEAPFRSQRLSVVLRAPRQGESLGVILYKFAEMSPVVAEIEPGSAAEDAGVIKPGDVILAVGGIAAGGLTYTTHLLSSMLDRPTCAVELLIQRSIPRDRLSAAEGLKPEGRRASQPSLSSKSGDPVPSKREAIVQAHGWLGLLEEELLAEDAHEDDQQEALLRDVSRFERNVCAVLNTTSASDKKEGVNNENSVPKKRPSGVGRVLSFGRRGS